VYDHVRRPEWRHSTPSYPGFRDASGLQRLVDCPQPMWKHSPRSASAGLGHTECNGLARGRGRELRRDYLPCCRTITDKLTAGMGKQAAVQLAGNGRWRRTDWARWQRLGASPFRLSQVVLARSAAPDPNVRYIAIESVITDLWHHLVLSMILSVAAYLT